MTSPNKPKVLYAKEDHSHPLEAHDHTHEHAATPYAHSHEIASHTHSSDDLVRAVRAIIRVFEVGVTNSEQSKALHNVRVAIGDAYGTGCLHEQRAFEKGDRLICQSCRLDVTRQFKT